MNPQQIQLLQQSAERIFLCTACRVIGEIPRGEATAKYTEGHRAIQSFKHHEVTAFFVEFWQHFVKNPEPLHVISADRFLRR